MDAFSTFYGPDKADRTMFVERVFGLYWPVYWGTIVFNIAIPQLFWFRRIRLNQPALILISFGIMAGMVLERYEIVVTSLHRPRLPSSWGNFFGTFWDWSGPYLATMTLPATGTYTIFLDPANGRGGILNVIDGVGGPSTIANPDTPVTVVHYP